MRRRSESDVGNLTGLNLDFHRFHQISVFRQWIER